MVTTRTMLDVHADKRDLPSMLVPDVLATVLENVFVTTSVPFTAVVVSEGR